MNRNIDALGRIVIPKEIRKRLSICEDDTLNIEVVENKIILSKDNTNYKQRLEKAIKYIKDLYDVRFTDKDKRALSKILEGEQE